MNDLVYVKLIVNSPGWSNHFRSIEVNGEDVVEVDIESLESYEYSRLAGYKTRIFSAQDTPMMRWCEILDGNNFVSVHGGVTFEVDDYVTEFNDELWYVSRLLKKKKLRGVFCNTEWQKKNLIENFGMGMDKIHVVGFPIASSLINKYRTTRVDNRLVMCPGRFDPEKTLPLYAHALYPLLSEGYRVVFTTNVSRSEMAKFDPQMMLFVSCLKRRGFELYFGLNCSDYYSLLASAGAVVIRGFADSFNIVAVESAYLGRRVVCPDVPPYDELFSDGLFRAFDEKQMVDMIRSGKGATLRSSDRYMDHNVMGRQLAIARDLSE